ncbi:MAG: hypothetical protein CK531_09000 [Gemmatimonadetes bacterium]|nr:MAG: hypothetical protein CK531_09690 [Gemmatimonadota bacterium]PHX96445.1 MAG: hypothetical protein CK531_09000 [Gemmatimonadota bacterium]
MAGSAAAGLETGLPGTWSSARTSAGIGGSAAVAPAPIRVPRGSAAGGVTRSTVRSALATGSLGGGGRRTLESAANRSAAAFVLKKPAAYTPITAAEPMAIRRLDPIAAATPDARRPVDCRAAAGGVASDSGFNSSVTVPSSVEYTIQRNQYTIQRKIIYA